MSPRIVEIIGPAGAGKTTLSRALSPCRKSFFVGNFPDVRKISNAPFFIRNGFQTLPALHKLPRGSSRKLTRREFAWLSILNGWSDILQKETKNKIVILDQGPVFLLTETREFGPEYLRNENADFLWQSLYSRWGNVLDMIVWLDAPDADLMSRIRHRDKGHVVKNESDETTFEFFARYRQAYERTISKLQANHSDLKILRFDTSQKSSDEIAYQLLFEFGTD
ncbi:MAG: AAA family ATPase [Chloroflexi bacterium]|nr:AAA family ATPase [Chloroflexota bacterium]